MTIIFTENYLKLKDCIDAYSRGFCFDKDSIGTVDYSYALYIAIKRCEITGESIIFYNSKSGENIHILTITQ